MQNAMNKAFSDKRLSLEEGVSLFEEDLLDLGRAANQRMKIAMRQYYLSSSGAKKPENIVTFIIDRNITLTNVCLLGCRFCAFSVKPGSGDAYLLSEEEVFRKIEELLHLGGTQVMLQGGIHPGLSLDYYCHLLEKIKKNFDVWLHSLSPTEIYCLSKTSGLSIKDVLQKLKDAGLGSLPGAAEILVDRVRKIVSPHKISTDQWLEVMETAHSIGMHSTATMTFGMMETKAERIEHMLKIRDLQDRTGGFKAFIPWTFSPANTDFSTLQPAGGIDYLKTLAISRIMLDNIPHIHAGWVTEGHKLAQIGLNFGANDLGGILMEEKVVCATGVSYQTSVARMIKIIKGAGKIPAQRNTRYEILRMFTTENESGC